MKEWNDGQKGKREESARAAVETKVTASRLCTSPPPPLTLSVGALLRFSYFSFTSYCTTHTHTLTHTHIAVALVLPLRL